MELLPLKKRPLQAFSASSAMWVAEKRWPCMKQRGACSLTFDLKLLSLCHLDTFLMSVATSLTSFCCSNPNKLKQTLDQGTRYEPTGHWTSFSLHTRPTHSPLVRGWKSCAVGAGSSTSLHSTSETDSSLFSSLRTSTPELWGKSPAFDAPMEA